MQINGIVRKTACFANRYVWKTKEGGDIDGSKVTDALLSG
ncbi:hypothetical protein BSBH6_00739 [Bacillus subtilis]|nr:hypothetical protein BSBH6_00739 [Bacillus subtilis]RPK27102.1 hypothetical protein BH5_00737 [Bacillus subtilis]